MAKIQLTMKQVLGYVIVGIKNGNYQAAINLAQECINEIDAKPKTNKPLDSDSQKPPQDS